MQATPRWVRSGPRYVPQGREDQARLCLPGKQAQVMVTEPEVLSLGRAAGFPGDPEMFGSPPPTPYGLRCPNLYKAMGLKVSATAAAPGLGRFRGPCPCQVTLCPLPSPYPLEGGPRRN